MVLLWFWAAVRMTFELKATAGEENDLVINDCLCKAHIYMTESKKSAGFRYARVSVFSNSKSVPVLGLGLIQLRNHTC